jgi:FkbM family methyltransferase
MIIVKLVQKCLRSLGCEVVPYPPRDRVRSRDSLRRALKLLSIDCVLDVGANHGRYGDQLRDLGYKGWIVSFEPASGPFKELSIRAAARPPWRVFQYALGSENGQAEIMVNANDELTSFLTPIDSTKTIPRNRIIGKESVEVRRLDSIFDECMAGIDARNIYLKIDTQGYDMEVLRGAEGVLPQLKGAQTEVSFIPIYDGMPSYLESIREFEARGFRVVDIMPVSRDDGELLMVEMDCILARVPEQA